MGEEPLLLHEQPGLTTGARSWRCRPRRLHLALSGPLSVGELTRLAEDRTVPSPNSVGGVAAASVVGRLPVALGVTEGSELRRPIAGDPR